MDVSFTDCTRLLAEKGLARDAAGFLCDRGRNAAWFEVAVANIGGRRAFATECTITAFSESDGLLFSHEIPAEPAVPGPGLSIEPTKTVRFRWYNRGVGPDQARLKPEGPVDRYQVDCPADEYGRFVPV